MIWPRYLTNYTINYYFIHIKGPYHIPKYLMDEKDMMYEFALK